ncbi:hypothetical protein E2C01_026041 [Portunus trituberculatus]|uniref:Uncharacterized protein n=1 Tax=Portunus trituberculatus TaxID=210409 RepID=A0A5B7EH44_PORTR|nr:hypothetical protein [Portunus trituberculatus]
MERRGPACLAVERRAAATTPENINTHRDTIDEETFCAAAASVTHLRDVTRRNKEAERIPAASE